MEKNKKIFIFVVIAIGLCIIAGIKIFESEGNARYEVTQSNDIEKEGEESDSIDNQNMRESNVSEVTVYISGAVKTEGVITMSSEDRLSDAIKVMGGVVEGADMNAINLAEKLVDGKHYIIPKKGEQIANDVNSGVASSAIQSGEGSTQGGTQQGGLININTATVEQLDSLPGVGEATANKIINYREEHGGFKSIEDLKNVKGIGDKKFEDMKGSICV